jgi:DnaJ-class molecular chaperone
VTENPEGLVPCPTCDGGARQFGQTNAGIFKRCPQCNGRTEVPAENPEGLAATTKRRMFEMGMPVGSDMPEAQRMGAPPLHVCDPDLCCWLCDTHATPHRNCILR